ncbi:hypothetical protein COO60DRAFT_756626 [Scenedesmus sp. NREL 46B-D3]|nr:hypothetical protein COO60DRAFT_756626 [Scenedesmus sp. NREL 46B-D3]
MIPAPQGAPGAAKATAEAVALKPAPARRALGSAALASGAAASAQRQHTAAAAATAKVGTAGAGGSTDACMPPAARQQPSAATAAVAARVEHEVVELIDNEEKEERQAAAAAAAAADDDDAAAADDDDDDDDGYEEAEEALRSGGAGGINLTSKSRSYGSSGNRQDTRVMIMRRLRAALAAAGAAGQGETLAGVYDDINTKGGLSKRGLKWKQMHLDAFYTRVLGPKGAPGSAPWPLDDELKPYVELRYLARESQRATCCVLCWPHPRCRCESRLFCMPLAFLLILVLYG